jgi:hypothetical protein
MLLRIKLYQPLPDDLHASLLEENEEFEVITLEVDEQLGFAGSKQNEQWLWLVMHSKTRQILTFHVRKRNKAAGEALMPKLPADVKNNFLHR